MLRRIFSSLFATFFAASSSASDKWAVGTAEVDGRPLVIRYLLDVPDGVKPSDLPKLIAIVWRFESDSGMPSSAEKLRMNDLEDSIASAVEPPKHAFLTTVVTGNGICEWQFYSADVDEFMRLLNEALAGKPVFPIELSFHDDPEWSAYHQIKK